MDNDTLRPTSNSDGPARAPQTSGPGSLSPVVCAHIGSARSKVGLELARALHRPCVDIANASFASATHVPAGINDDISRAEAAWFDSVVRPDSGHVVVGPCSLLGWLSHSAWRSDVWVAWLDVEPDHLIRQAQLEAPGLDVDLFADHIRQYRAFVDECDDVIDATGLAVDGVVERLVERFHAVGHAIEKGAATS